jgi:microcystin-dependent protein
MGTPYLAEIKVVSFNFPPKGWALCNGQLLPINQNQALFALLGTTFGGNGQTNFALPNLQGRVPIHTGGGFQLGQAQGEYAHTLTAGEMPQHTHPVNASPKTGTQVTPAGTVWAATTSGAYAGAPTVTMHPQSVNPVGGSQAHENTPPYLTLNFIIALQGIFPSHP